MGDGDRGLEMEMALESELDLVVGPWTKAGT